MKSISTYLLFVGNQAGKAEEAINFYISLFDNSEIINIEYYDPDESEPESSVRIARFTLNNVEFMAEDSSLNHKFTFTPSMSLFIECESLDEINFVYQSLLKGGSELVPLENHGNSGKFGWLNDKYGISWQLNLAE